jgi:restriction system protein
LKACLVEATRRAHFQITDRGQQILASNPDRVDIPLLNQFEEFRQFRQSGGANGYEQGNDDLAVQEQHTPDERMRQAHQQLEAALGQEMLARIMMAPPSFFERLVVSLLIAMGYGGSVKDAGRALGRSGDDGVDGVIDQDVLGLDRVYIQAKRYGAGNSIGAGAIRDVFGSLDRHKASKGLFVTTSNFSPAARETAEFLSKRIVLIDGAQLAAS